MERSLYSELRTLYETTAEDPHTFRITVTLADDIDGARLRGAVARTMLRYPYFCVRLCMRGGEPCFADNPAPVPVIRTDRRIVLGSERTAGHLLAFCYWKNELHIDASHAMTDGGGIYPVIRTLLYEYCSDRYDAALSRDGVRLCGGEIPPEEWDDPALRPLGKERQGLVAKWDRPAFQIADGGVARLTPECVSHNLSLPEQSFMRFNFSNDGSPATIVALLLARTIDALHPDAPCPPVIAMCVNQRRALGTPLAHQSLVGDVRLPYTERMKNLSFTAQATSFRGMVALQSDADMVLDEIRDYQDLMEQLRAMEDPRERQACCVRRMEERSRWVTATVSYTGKADMGEAERYIRAFDALPSTALPSIHVPLTVELSAANGMFFLNFMQYFREDDYFSLFVRQLREAGIDFEVRSTAAALYPRIELGALAHARPE